MENTFWNLQERIEAAFHAGEYETVMKLAEEHLRLAESFKKNWNYGNVIHKNHIVLGRVALRQGNIAQAQEHLRQAGKTPGSPQLSTFGPNMTLAKELLEQGEREIVLEYFELCKKFWWWSFRVVPIHTWKKAIKRGTIPDFGANLLYSFF